MYEAIKESKDDKILIIGGGVVGSSTAVFLDYFGVSKIFISSSSSGHKNYQSLFGVNTMTDFSGLGGLGNFWHGVINVDSIQKKDIDQNSILQVFNLIMGFRPKESDLYKEIIPTLTPRPKKILKKVGGSLKILPPCVKIEKNVDMVRAFFADGTDALFNKVFVCNGSINDRDILVESGLADVSQTISDQLICYEDEVFDVDSASKKKLSTKLRTAYIAREYDVVNGVKVTYRPSYGKASNISKGKSIYLDSPFKVFLSLLKPSNFFYIFESLYLRYGILFPVKKYRRFFQINVKDCYYRKKGQFKINDLEVDRLLKKLSESGMSVSRPDFLSGIHYYNSLEKINDSVGFYNSQDEKCIYLLSASSIENPGAKHFTFGLIYNSFILIRRIYSPNSR